MIDYQADYKIRGFILFQLRTTVSSKGILYILFPNISY